MNQNDQGTNDFPWSKWMESSANLWLSAAQSWQELSTSLADVARSEEYMKVSLAVWQAFQPLWTGTQCSEAKDTSSPPFDMLQALMRVSGSGGLSEELFKWLWNKGEATGRGIEEVQREAVKAWTGFHEKEIQPLLKIPQVGLTRVYQEKINRFADKFNTYQAAVMEFRMLLAVPMEKSFIEMKEQLDKLREQGELTEEFKVYYGMWIKVLESHYMSLFKTDEYRQALSRLLDETAAFKITGNDVLTEVLEFLPIPTNREMDEVYKELYTLKKQTRQANKKISNLESALTKKDAQ
jgi:polyhydroxyalkanoate synthase subunit PhaE